ncbi:TFIIH basal transcription factor complex TTD-A subunit [Cryptococcus wingfieldii CBS 7118]|uniref:General transcription and DNA repair factor IIH subunit TFB5 n=1 Tax=Cryptococcus wingfieldii CBS 7118 TaxID=1295528 RepID=A0A1E3JF86_9TREE|nr:TFIIH basal transcription factor complex TTD-A subunit [Cryptococcus wingfieldii CBS 7118]ODN99504.1 TFIIH basal transcription factor complex TTD-A subunit [Cryptococcus wingfieldii CBS 7118]
MNTDSYRVKITSGVLVTCDSAAKQILLHLDSLRDGNNKFVALDWGDENKVLIKKDYVEHVKEALQDELEKNTYVQDPNV